MQLRDFHHWLGLADRSEHPRAELLDLLEEVLEGLPDEEAYDRVAAAVERMLEDPAFESSHVHRLEGLLDRLFAPTQTPVERVLEELGQLADGLSQEKVSSERFGRMERLLAQLARPDLTEPEQIVMGQHLSALKEQFRQLWHSYKETPVEAGETTAESVAGHIFLKEGFQLWLQAFALAEAGQWEAAREAAWEGNRQLAAVSHWSDQLRPMPSSVLGQA